MKIFCADDIDRKLAIELRKREEWNERMSARHWVRRSKLTGMTVLNLESAKDDTGKISNSNGTDDIATGSKARNKARRDK